MSSEEIQELIRLAEKGTFAKVDLNPMYYKGCNLDQGVIKVFNP